MRTARRHRDAHGGHMGMIQPRSDARLTCLSFQSAVDTFLPNQEPSVIRSICLLACLSLTPFALAQNGNADKEWFKELKAAQSAEIDCFKSDLPEDCVPALAAYQRVFAAPDATDGIRHEVFRYAINVQGVYAKHFVEAGDLARGIAEYEKAWSSVMAHVGDGAHIHAVYESLDILLALSLAVDEHGDAQKASNLFSFLDQVVSRIKPDVETLVKDESDLKKRMAVNAILQGEKFYTYLGQKALRETFEAQAAGRSPAETAARAAAAFEAAAAWLDIAVKYDIQEFAGASDYERYIAIYLGWGDALLAADKPAEAREPYLAVYTLADKLITPENLEMMKEQAKSFGFASVGDYDVAYLLSARVNGLIGAAEAYSLTGKASDGLDLMTEAESLISEYAREMLKARDGSLAVGRYYYVDAKFLLGSWTKAQDIWDKIDGAYKNLGPRERAMISEIRTEAAKER